MQYEFADSIGADLPRGSFDIGQVVHHRVSPTSLLATRHLLQRSSWSGRSDIIRTSLLPWRLSEHSRGIGRLSLICTLLGHPRACGTPSTPVLEPRSALLRLVSFLVALGGFLEAAYALVGGQISFLVFALRHAWPLCEVLGLCELSLVEAIYALDDCVSDIGSSYREDFVGLAV